jgi:tetratricopeptide (TPR) repeat protein
MSASSEALYFFREASAMYMQLHGDGGDPAKKARLEKNVAQALLNRGQLLDAVEHFDLATGLLGAPAARKPASMMSGFAFNLVRVLGRLYLPLPRRKARRASASDNELFDVMFRRAMAQSTTEPIRFFVDCVALLRRLSAVDPMTVPESAAMYSGVVGIFTFGGLSFDVSRRFLEIARELAEHGAVDERRLYYSTLRFMHHMLEGNWDEQYEPRPDEIEEGIAMGRFWEAATCLNLVGVKHIYRGDFDRSRTAMEQLQKLAEVYEHDLAASAFHAVAAYLHTERREFEAALGAIELYYDEHREPLFNLQAFATRGKVQLLMGQPEVAAETLGRAGELLAEAGRAPPWHASTYRSARYLADVSELDRAVRSGEGDVRALRKRAAASRRPALAGAEKVAWRRPEVLRLVGQELWLSGNEREAIDWWRRAIRCCAQLRVRPEVGRTWQLVGEALLSSGRDEEAWRCLEAARAIFTDLDLRFDLLQLPGAGADKEA